MIEVKNLSKSFGQKLAVDNISFTVNRGEVLGFLGPNGAGKSTTMRMITGYLPPTSGTAVTGGYDIINASLSARKRIGYLPENAPVYPDMTVIGFLDFIAGIRGFTGPERIRRVDEVLEKCFLSNVRFQTINTLSKGFKQRVCLAQSIIHDPEYLIMDEPTDGLDPNQKHEVRTMIMDMAREKTIILSTHILEEVDAVCTRVIIIADGRIMVDDTPEALKARSSVHGAVRVRIRQDHGKDILSGLDQIPGVRMSEVVSEDDGDLSIRIYPEEAGVSFADMIFQYFQKKGIRVESLFVEEGRLDEVFRTITAGGPSDSGPA